MTDAESAQIPHLSDREIEEFLHRAATSTRRRSPKILHSAGDRFNMVVNFIMQDSYMQPHLHPGVEKIETIHLIRGQLAVLFFDDRGAVRSAVVLRKGEMESIAVPAFTWHTYVVLTDHAVTYETMFGEYEPRTWKDFAPWAPGEDSPKSPAYLQLLKEEAARRMPYRPAPGT
jgi:cupin fold WbuC family metalloprotein